MNQNSPGIGRNKLLFGNTNISLLVPGRIANYVTKYVFKSTQEDDNEEYTHVTKRVENTVNAINQRNLELKAKEHEGQLSGEERKEANQTNALAAVLRLGFNLTDSNVIGAPLASYLLRNESRFTTSHQCKYVSMHDIEALLEGRNVSRYRYDRRYTTNNAYDYLCRPEELEAMSARDFYTDYVHQKSQPTDENGGIPFINTDQLTHPSWKEGRSGKAGYFRGCMRPLKPDEPVLLVQIARRWLPDTAGFQGSIKEGTINAHTELYCQRALMLCVPYREMNDLRLRGPGNTKVHARNFGKRSSREAR